MPKFLLPVSVGSSPRSYSFTYAIVRAPWPLAGLFSPESECVRSTSQAQNCNRPTGFCIRPVEIQCSVISIISFCRPRWATVQISGLPVIVREIVLPHKSQLFMRCQLDSNGSQSVTLDTRGSSRLRREFSVLAEGRHIFGLRSKPPAAKPREKLFAQVTIFV